MLRGAFTGDRLPTRSITVPSWSYSMSCGSSTVSSGSMIDTSTSWPRPVARRAHSALSAANAVVMPVTVSASPNGGRVGGPSWLPLRLANPLIDSASVPNPGCVASGPVWPKPVTCAMTSSGWSALSAA
jgi:hypothetical protein